MPRLTPIPNRPSRPELVVVRSEPNPRRESAGWSSPAAARPPTLASAAALSGSRSPDSHDSRSAQMDAHFGPHSADSDAENRSADQGIDHSIDHSGVHTSVRGDGRGNTVLTDAVLVENARNGHVWAQEALFHRHSRMVLGLAQRILAGRDDAEDLAQDVFVYALGRLDSLNNPQAFSSWLGSIVVRTASKRLRRQRLMVRLGLRRNEPIDPNTIVSRTAPSDVGAELRVVYSMLSGMPTEQRIALVLRRVEGMELKEIAEHMGLSLATVKRRLSDAEGRVNRAMARF